MVVFPNAKINLGLRVVERRSDGYHNLETVFYPVKFCDILEVIRAEEFYFRQTGLEMDIPSGENLVVMAFRMLERQFNLPPVKIHLHKMIPSGAGLGGGSSDAGFMLKMLNDIFHLQLTPEQLIEKAGKLGADCPFFINNYPAFATGTGNILQPVHIDLSGYQIIIIKPPVNVNTAMAYHAIQPGRPVVSLTEIIIQPVENWNESLVNDFERTVFRIFPEISKIRDELYSLGAAYASMSGSGSAVYGLFREIPENIASRFPENYFVYP